jgi:hypothetical protein
MRWMSRSWKKLMLVMVSAMSLFPHPALAQDASGKFTLPREVRWGIVTLPAGTYSYSIEHRAGETILLRGSSGGPSVIVMASSISTVDAPETSRLVLQRQGSEWYVASMVLSGDGEELHFTPPSKKAEVAQDAKLHPAKLAALSHP